eukprot:gnl/MRDRNA2_/MRDRNA2_104863_c0_seq1.p1 gnl/MRDRNA2_/MRDRNA2_104863_c0~~gnl/MRDRNA2_/MRDRNA2_104863_c0_seq1.p1  ORF type:complete len:250 (-),score=61.24 gnl/MRDRNA2_/MRDRNA2_104863_c0_seq1:237-932(-)
MSLKLVQVFLFFVGLNGTLATRQRKPLPLANLTVQGDASALAALKSKENDLVDTLFKMVKDLVKIEKKAEAAANKANLTANGTATQSGAHPNGQYGDAKEEYMEIKADQKDAVGAKFEPACVTVLQEMVANRMVTLAKIGMPDESVGLDIATNFQVQCPGAIPMPEKSCDKHATALAKLIDAKKIWKKAALLQSSKVTSEPQSGQEWCHCFFTDFFDAVVALVIKTKAYQR